MAKTTACAHAWRWIAHERHYFCRRCQASKPPCRRHDWHPSSDDPSLLACAKCHRTLSRCRQPGAAHVWAPPQRGDVELACVVCDRRLPVAELDGAKRLGILGAVRDRRAPAITSQFAAWLGQS